MRRTTPALLLLTAALAACTDNSCYDNGSALPLVRFYASGTTTQATVSALTVRGLDSPGDSLLVDGKATSELYLPLRATANATQWELDYGTDWLCDTLTLNYRAIPHFAGVECGAMYNFELLEVAITTHVADSVTVAKPVIDNGTDVALRIYLPTDD